MMSAFFTIFLILAVLVKEGISASINNEVCSLFELDKCAARVLVFANRTSHPLEISQIDQECSTEWENYDCIKRFDENCLTGITSGMLKILLEGINNERESRCDSHSKRRLEYNKYIGCLNTAGEQLKKCMKLMAGYLESATQKPVKDRVKLSCCSFANYRTCLKDATASKCDGSHVVYADSILQGVAGDLLSTVCSKYKTGSKSCNVAESLIIPEKQLFTTLLPPLTEVLKALG